MKIGIIGGGAAGVFAAINIKEHNPRFSVTILEKSNQLLQKVKISGGGRCNVTHYCFEPEMLAANYPRGQKELVSVFHQFQPADTIEWFARRNVPLKAEPDGRMFPETDNSQTIINCFLNEINRLHITVRFRSKVTAIIPENNGWTIKTPEKTLFFDKIVVASGGLNSPEKYSFLQATKHRIVPPVPSLFTFQLSCRQLRQLAGISLPEVKISLPELKKSYEDALLITHQGISGPAVIKLSAFAARELADTHYQTKIRINWVNASFDTIRQQLNDCKQTQGNKKVKNSPQFGLPKRLWEFLVIESGLADTSWQNAGKKPLRQLAQNISEFTTGLTGKSTFKEEFVTCGGISRKEINFKTMQSRLHPGLFFAGEVIDIDALTGGFNFQAAWSTAWITAKNMG